MNSTGRHKKRPILLRTRQRVVTRQSRKLRTEKAPSGRLNWGLVEKLKVIHAQFTSYQHKIAGYPHYLLLFKYMFLLNLFDIFFVSSKI